MSAMPPTLPRVHFLDATGSPLSGGFVHVYLAGTTTRTNSWQDRAQLTVNTNPIELDAAGSCLLRLDPSTACKIVVTDASGVAQSHLGGDNLYGTASLADLTAAVEADMDAAVADAEAAQLAAEIARDTALTTGRLYVDTTAGLAAVASGEHFLVPVTTSNYTELILYLDSAGTAVEKGRWSISYMEGNYLAQHVFADRNGEVFAYFDQNGELRLNGNARGVDQRLEDARAKAFFAACVGADSAALGNTSASAELARTAALVDSTLGGAAWAGQQVKVLEMAGTAQYRFPTIMQIEPGRLLLFAGDLLVPTGIDDVHACRIVVCDVDFNFRTKSYTVSAPRIVVSNRAFTSGASTAYALGHTPVRQSDHTLPNYGRIYLMYGSNKDDPATIASQKPYLTYSDDDGVTWAASVEFTPGRGTLTNYGFGTGMKGIQLRYGTNRGRMVFPWYAETSAGKTQCFGIYSDDGGNNWTKGTPFGSLAAGGLTEPSFAEHTDGSIYALCRDDAPGPTQFELWVSADGGATFTFVKSMLTNNGVEGSMIQAAGVSPNSPKMIAAWPNSGSDRSNLSLTVSYDGWDTASTTKLLYNLDAGYSGIEAVGEDYFLVAWESKYYAGFVADTIFIQAMNINYILS